jgi:HPt (histidine-containing phosphotransfer) domain-containing protein
MIKEEQKFKLDNLEQIASGDKAFMIEMINVFITSTKEELVNIEEGAKNKLWDKVAGYVHKVKSPVKHFEANSIVNLLETLETNTKNQINLENVPTLIEKLKEETNELFVLLKKEQDRLVTSL